MLEQGLSKSMSFSLTPSDYRIFTQFEVVVVALSGREVVVDEAIFGSA